MHALRSTRVPVPTCFHLCEDPDVIGSPFYLCQFVDGVVYLDPLIPEAALHKSQRKNGKDARFAIYHELYVWLTHSSHPHLPCPPESPCWRASTL